MKQPARQFKYLDPQILQKVTHIELKARMMVEGLYASRHRSPFYGFSAEFVDHREYSPGDDPRSIDWRTYARTDRLYVKRFEMESNMNVISLLDVSGSMGYEPQDKNRLRKLEYGCFLAAALNYLVLKQQDSAGLITFDTDIRDFIPPGQGDRHLYLMLNHLEGLKAGAETKLGTTLTRLASRITRRGIVVLISDCHDAPEDIAAGIRQIATRGHELIVFQLLDHDEVVWPFKNLCNFKDMETGAMLMGDPLALRQTYLKRLSEFTSAIEKGCNACGTDYRLIDTSMPIEDVLQSYLLIRRQVHR
ncbi:MAG TPA: DUF58 domain-containing protein [Planctomycetota bacterium]|nr:DUF58 domain-containing protein [Planctomycetota bacterium]